eukprot:sb/3462526/
MRIYLKQHGVQHESPEEGGRLLDEILEQFPRGVLDKELSRSIDELLVEIPRSTEEVVDKARDGVKSVVGKVMGWKESLAGKLSGMVKSGEKLVKTGLPNIKSVVEGWVEDPGKAEDWIKSILDTSSEQSQQYLSAILANRVTFHSSVEYLQLKTEDHFKTFCASIPPSDKTIFYLSIPPSAFVSTAQLISKHCNNPRIAVEKPFGYSKSTAQELFSSLQSLVAEEEIYLVDHYLGKTITQLLPGIITSHNLLSDPVGEISSVEVALLESLDCEGRAGYYDDSGVFRDMLQNHVTELALLILTRGGVRDKTEVLQSFTRPNKHQVVEGQYQSYQKHVGHPSNTPTFASVLLYSQLPEWEGIPIVLTSGKSQGRERKEIRVVYKSGSVLEVSFKPPRISFAGNNLLPTDTDISNNSYEVLLHNVITGTKSLLPSIPSTLASWDLWDHIISLPTPLTTHPDRTTLEVDVVGRFLVPRNLPTLDPEPSSAVVTGGYRITPLGEDDIYRHVVRDLLQLLEESEGADFHVGVAGGSSILGVYKHLLVSREQLKRRRVHLWQTDERCKGEFRNSHDLKRYFADYIGDDVIIHLLPVTESGCGDLDSFQREFQSYIPARRFDYVVLGVGSDGHVASLFPTFTTLHSTPDFLIISSPNAPHSTERITVNMDLINRSRVVVVVVVGGEEKRGVVDVIRGGGEGSEMPVLQVGAAEKMVLYVQKELFY